MNSIQEGATGQPGFVRSAATKMMGETGGNLAVDGANIASSGFGLVQTVTKPGAWKLFRNISSDYVPYYKTASRSALTTEVGASAISTADAIDRSYGK